jgi:hypothetical protein
MFVPHFPHPPLPLSALKRFRTQSCSFFRIKFGFFTVYCPIYRWGSVVRLDLAELPPPVSSIPGAPVLDLRDSVPIGCGIPEIDGLFRSGSGAGADCDVLFA